MSACRAQQPARDRQDRCRLRELLAAGDFEAVRSGAVSSDPTRGEALIDLSQSDRDPTGAISGTTARADRAARQHGLSRQSVGFRDRNGQTVMAAVDYARLKLGSREPGCSSLHIARRFSPRVERRSRTPCATPALVSSGLVATDPRASTTSSHRFSRSTRVGSRGSRSIDSFRHRHCRRVPPCRGRVISSASSNAATGRAARSDRNAGTK